MILSSLRVLRIIENYYMKVGRLCLKVVFESR